MVNEQFDKFASIYRPFIKEIEPFNEYVKLLEPETAIPITSEAKHQAQIKFVSIKKRPDFSFIRMTLWSSNVS